MTSRLLKLTLSTWLVLAAVGCIQPRTHAYRCAPGERIDVSCGELGLGEMCTGTGRIRICDAALNAGACTGSESLIIEGDSSGCPLATTYCPASGAFSVLAEGNAAFQCNWQARRTPVQSATVASFACEPGQQVRASCGCGMGRYCVGDPSMTACIGTTSACARDDADAWNGDHCGNCPLVEVLCPSSGSVTFEASGSSSTSFFQCEFQAVGADWVALSRIGV